MTDLEHKYISTNTYCIVRIEAAERNTKKNKLDFVITVSYWPLELGWKHKKTFKTSDPKLILPKDMAIVALRTHAEHLKLYRNQNAMVGYANTHLAILRKFCVQHRYKLHLVLGPEYSGRHNII